MTLERTLGISLLDVIAGPAVAAAGPGVAVTSGEVR